MIPERWYLVQKKVGPVSKLVERVPNNILPGTRLNEFGKTTLNENT